MEQNAEIIANAIESSLNIIEQDREKEIISRRFGISGKKETLEQIGEMLSITRERVRQLEKVILIRLRIGAEENQIPALVPAEKLLIRNLTEMGRVARVSDLAAKLFGEKSTSADEASLVFLAEISPNLTVLNENDKYFESIGIAEYGSEKVLKDRIDEIVSIIKANKSPLTIDELDEKLTYEHPDHIRAIASTSKLLAHLNNLWGLTKWPTVNPKNIRDKIFVILKSENQPMHFNKIAEAIAESNFRRKNVTVQAIHNELIKDPRFVLIGRGIYALDSWGYEKGTVSDIIMSILKKESPLTREEIIKRVLHTRKVKETTILLNLQNKDLFEKVGKNGYQIKK